MIETLAAGGTELQLLSLIRGLDRSRVHPHLVLLDGTAHESIGLEPDDCDVLRLGIRRLRTFHAARQAIRLSRFLRSRSVEVLQLYGYRDCAAFGTLVGRLAGVRAVIRVRNNLGHWMTPSDKRLFKCLNRYIDATVTNSEAGRLAAMEQEGIRAEKLWLIENSIEMGLFSPRESIGTRTSVPKRIGIVSNLRRVKGIDVFIRSAAAVTKEYPHATFHIAGEGEERPVLEGLILRHGLSDHVFLHGRIDDIPAFLATLDVAVLSSRAEGQSNALLEYMAVGLPIVATSVGAANDLLESGRLGLLVPPEDEQSLARAIMRVLQNPAEFAEMGQSARDAVASRFCPRERAGRFERLYEELVQSVRDGRAG